MGATAEHLQDQRLHEPASRPRLQAVKIRANGIEERLLNCRRAIQSFGQHLLSDGRHPLIPHRERRYHRPCQLRLGDGDETANGLPVRQLASVAGPERCCALARLGAEWTYRDWQVHLAWVVPARRSR